MKNNTTFASDMIRDAIIKRLKERKISMRQCALDNGVDCSNFQHFLKGRRPFPLDDVERILRYLDLKVK